MGQVSTKSGDKLQPGQPSSTTPDGQITCRLLLSKQKQVEFTATHTNIIYGQKYLYFSLPTSTCFKDYDTIICTFIQNNLNSVVSTFKVNEFKYLGVKRNQTGPFHEYGTSSNNEVLHTHSELQNANQAELFARTQCKKQAKQTNQDTYKDQQAIEQSRMIETSVPWTLVWRYNVQGQ